MHVTGKTHWMAQIRAWMVVKKSGNSAPLDKRTIRRQHAPTNTRNDICYLARPARRLHSRLREGVGGCRRRREVLLDEGDGVVEVELSRARIMGAPYSSI